MGEITFPRARGLFFEGWWRVWVVCLFCVFWTAMFWTASWSYEFLFCSTDRRNWYFIDLHCIAEKVASNVALFDPRGVKMLFAIYMAAVLSMRTLGRWVGMRFLHDVSHRFRSAVISAATTVHYVFIFASAFVFYPSQVVKILEMAQFQ